MIRIKDLYVYPVKSCKGVRVEEIKLSPTGFLGDRNWMVIDERGVFVSQREQPKLALVEPKLIDGKLALNAPGAPELVVAREVKDGERTEVELFGERISSLSAGHEAASWFSRYLGGDYRVVACDPEFLRRGGVQYPSRDEAPNEFRRQLWNSCRLRSLPRGPQQATGFRHSHEPLPPEHRGRRRRSLRRRLFRVGQHPGRDASIHPASAIHAT